ncbi:MAG: hypothetical protein IPN53_17040 [Comamonadaceae bacterium]|nr:hypothetical protein [Comamonadaceae bacterium]
MSLLAMLKGGRPKGFANAKTANLANVGAVDTATLATLATIALANLPRPLANDSALTPTKVQADLPTPDVKGLPTTPVDGAVIDVGTIRPAGLSAKLLAASLALDAQINVAGPLGWCAGVANPDGDKPKGMHWKTYLRLMNELNRHSIAALQSTDEMVKRLTGKLAGIGGM